MTQAEFDDAIGNAARILSAARQPVITGLDTDIAGVVAACRLAERIGAAIDHDASDSALRFLGVLRDAGMMWVTPTEGLALADTLLTVGERPLAESPGPLSAALDGSQRNIRIVSLRAGGPPPRNARRDMQSLDAGTDGMPGLLGALRARVNGRPAGAKEGLEEIDSLVATLHEASFGVVAFAPEELDALATEMLAGLVKDLNISTRWSTISIPESVTATGAMMATAWMTALPLRSAFIGGRWQHDPWRFEAKRMLAAGEADAALYICCYAEPPPDWLPDIPSVLLVNTKQVFPRRNSVRIAVGQPGRDHDGVLYDRMSASLAHRKASAPTNAPSAASVLDRIAARIATS